MGSGLHSVNEGQFRSGDSETNDMFQRKLYYRRLWKKQKLHQPMPSRLRTFEDYVRLVASLSEPSSLVLDVGCDSGIVARMLEAKGYHNLVGIDLANRFTHTSKISYVVAENTHLPFRNGVFDAIFARKFVSIPDTQRTLGELNRISRKDAKLVVEVPNVDRLKSRIYRLLGMTPNYAHKYFPHLTLSKFKDLLRGSQFDVLQARGDYVYIPIIGNILSRPRLEIVQRALGRARSTLCLHIYAVCGKSSSNQGRP